MSTCFVWTNGVGVMPNGDWAKQDISFIYRVVFWRWGWKVCLKITQNLTHISFFISCEAQLILKDSLANTVFTECIHQTLNPAINHSDFCPRRLSEGQSRAPLKPGELLQWEGPDVRNEGPHHCQAQTANSRTDAAATTWHVRKTLDGPLPSGQYTSQSFITIYDYNSTELKCREYTTLPNHRQTNQQAWSGRGARLVPGPWWEDAASV